MSTPPKPYDNCKPLSKTEAEAIVGAITAEKKIKGGLFQNWSTYHTQLCSTFSENQKPEERPYVVRIIVDNHANRGTYTAGAVAATELKTFSEKLLGRNLDRASFNVSAQSRGQTSRSGNWPILHPAQRQSFLDKGLAR